MVGWWVKPGSNIACDCDRFATKKIDNRGEVSKISERFYWSCKTISDGAPDRTGRELSFKHAQKTDRD